MKVILCLDEKQGMMIHRRRQSQDRMLLEAIRKLCQGQVIRMSPYSAKLFCKADFSVQAEDDFLLKAEKGEYCFVEGESLEPVRDQIEELIIYWWNRTYPADLRLDLSLDEWEIQSLEEIKGFSHEKISREIRIPKN